MVLDKKRCVGQIFEREDGLEVESIAITLYGGVIEEQEELTLPQGVNLPKEVVLYRVIKDGKYYYRPRSDFLFPGESVDPKNPVPIFRFKGSVIS